MQTTHPGASLFTRLLLATACATCWCSPALRAATNFVDIIDFAFSPDQSTINVNDTIQWTWEGDSHSSTSDYGVWDSGVYNLPHSYSYTFTTPGSYPYSCVIHYFTGTVTVQAASAPPTVLITNPPAGEVLSAPASLTLQATTSDSAGTVTNVGFFNGGAPLGSLGASPFSWPVGGLGAGDYTFSAVATDTQGLTATNAVTVHVVAALPLALTAPQLLPGNTFQFIYTASTGLTYVIQRSSDLQAWVRIATNVAGTSPVVFQDQNASAGSAYYRVFRRPNP